MPYISHLQFSYDLKNGLFWGKSDLEFSYSNKENGSVTLNLYHDNDFLTSYDYDCRESAEKDMSEAERECGISFKPYIDFVTETKKIMGRQQLKKVI